MMKQYTKAKEAALKHGKTSEEYSRAFIATSASIAKAEQAHNADAVATGTGSDFMAWARSGPGGKQQPAPQRAGSRAVGDRSAKRGVGKAGSRRSVERSGSRGSFLDWADGKAPKQQLTRGASSGSNPLAVTAPSFLEWTAGGKSSSGRIPLSRAASNSTVVAGGGAASGAAASALEQVLSRKNTSSSTVMSSSGLARTSPPTRSPPLATKVVVRKPGSVVTGAARPEQGSASAPHVADWSGLLCKLPTGLGPATTARRNHLWRQVAANHITIRSQPESNRLPINWIPDSQIDSSGGGGALTTMEIDTGMRNVLKLEHGFPQGIAPLLYRAVAAGFSAAKRHSGVAAADRIERGEVQAKIIIF